MKLSGRVQGANRTFISWLASYGLILVIPLFMGIFAYVESIKNWSRIPGQIHAFRERLKSLGAEEALALQQTSFDKKSRLYAFDRNCIFYLAVISFVMQNKTCYF